ncbi:hypothetical protein [Campylobacter geochelonis]|uniref:COG4648 family protein n=1 Tax=Campylobacter geochelonis TaxID=1780362 RepID=UPI0007709DA6|nr:hypothetical protein [Campylobacter geochelonis]CZE49344.1 DNA gyrase subunit B [Campylobacter geochelonis]
MKTDLIFKILITIASIAYPFTLVFFYEFSKDAVFVMALLWGLQGIFTSDKNKKQTSALLSAFFVLILLANNDTLRYFYPVIINIFMLFVFGLSLKKEAIITKFARLKEPNLPEFVIAYTRNLTKIWIVFFAVNGAISFGLIFLEDKIYWGLYTGAISYVLIAALFVGEYIYRIKLKRQEDV